MKEKVEEREDRVSKVVDRGNDNGTAVSSRNYP